MTKMNHLPDPSKLHIKAELKKLTGTHVITVNPQLAEDWLKFNSNNRPLSIPHVEEYVGRMKRGEWVLNGQAIIFTSTGELGDGQHRLAAVVKLGEPVKFDVRFGIDPDTFSTIDDGKKRTAGDVFSIEKIPNYSNAAATVALIMGMERNNTQGTFNTQTRPSNREKLEWYLANEDVADFVLLGIKWYDASGRLLTPSKFAAYGYMMASVDYTKAMSFMEKLAFGFDLPMASPVFKLRAKLAQSRIDKTKRMPESYERALIIKAWNLFRAGKTVKILKYDTEREPFPVFE